MSQGDSVSGTTYEQDAQVYLNAWKAQLLLLGISPTGDQQTAYFQGALAVLKDKVKK